MDLNPPPTPVNQVLGNGPLLQGSELTVDVQPAAARVVNAPSDRRGDTGMADRTVSDLVVERLSTWGVDRVFGYSGDGIDGVMGALRRAGKPAFVQARHEEAAAFMAVGHAKYTGGPGVCVSTQGPGAVHLASRLSAPRAQRVRTM